MNQQFFIMIKCSQKEAHNMHKIVLFFIMLSIIGCNPNAETASHALQQPEYFNYKNTHVYRAFSVPVDKLGRVSEIIEYAEELVDKNNIKKLKICSKMKMVMQK